MKAYAAFAALRVANPVPDAARFEQMRGEEVSRRLPRDIRDRGRSHDRNHKESATDPRAVWVGADPTSPGVVAPPTKRRERPVDRHRPRRGCVGDRH